MSGITDLCKCRSDITRSVVKRFRNKCPRCLKPYKIVRPQYNAGDIVVQKESVYDTPARDPERLVYSTPNHLTPHKVPLNPEIVLNRPIDIPEGFSTTPTYGHAPDRLEVTDLDVDSDVCESVQSQHKDLLSSQQIIDAYADEILQNYSGSDNTVLEKSSRRSKSSEHIYEEPVTTVHRKHSLQDDSVLRDRYERRKQGDTRLVVNNRYSQNQNHVHDIGFWSVESSSNKNPLARSISESSVFTESKSENKTFSVINSDEERERFLNNQTNFDKTSRKSGDSINRQSNLEGDNSVRAGFSRTLNPKRKLNFGGSKYKANMSAPRAGSSRGERNAVQTIN